MNWHDEPICLPWTCSICGNGSENKLIHGPFLVTDWTYEQVSGAEYVDKLAAGNFRFTICAICVRSMVAMLTMFDPKQKNLLLETLGVSVGETAMPEINVGRSKDDEERAKLVHEILFALDERDREKAKNQMAKAREAKAAKRTGAHE